MSSPNVKTLLASILFVGSCLSCVSNSKIIYFQDLAKESSIQFGELISYEQSDEYRLQYNDIE